MASSPHCAVAAAPGAGFVEHPVLGRAIRGGDWTEQGVATSRLVVEAMARGDVAEGIRLARYFVTEAEVCHRLYRRWIPDLRGFLGDRGVPAGELAEVEARVSALLVLPDGTPWDAGRVWADLLARVEAMCARVAARPDTAHDVTADVDGIVETWRRCHDRDVDHISALMNEVVSRFGEEAIESMYDAILRPWFDERYSEFDVDLHPWADALTLNMLVAFEAMRGHLCGPGRRGDVGFEELEDRYVLTFDPCGSGGRTTRGDEIEGTPPRMAAPYDWPATQQPAPWNHYRPGVCVYCTHCIVLTEIMPIRAFGYPVRAVDPPRHGEATPDGRPATCSWTMFKDPGDVPAEYYTRVGESRPDRIGSGGLRREGRGDGADVPQAAPPESGPTVR